MPRTTSPSRRVRVAAATAVGAITLPLALLQAFPAHAAPSVGAPDSYTVAAGSTLTVSAPGVFANDSDADGEPLAITGNTEPSHGTLALQQATGAFSYTPAAGFSGADTFDYYLRDFDEADGVAGPFTVTITVTGSVATLAPVANDDAFTVDNDAIAAIGAPGLLANDSDGDSAFTVSNWTNPSQGALVVSPDGAFSYEPAAGYVGTDTFTYRLTDGQNLSGYATVTLTVVDPVEPATPVAVDDAYSVPAGQPTTIPAPAFLGNDSDADSNFFIQNTTEPAHGDVTFHVDGSITYAPDAGFTGVDTMTYQLMDPQGHFSNWATVTFTVGGLGLPQPPVAVDDFYSTSAGVPITIPAPGFLANDTDPDSSVLEISEMSEPSSGWITNQPDGSVVYSPGGFVGTETLTYRISDDSGLTSNTATVTFTVLPAAATKPVAVDDAYAVEADTPLTVAAPGVFANDSDADGDPFAFQFVGVPAGGLLPGEDIEFTTTGGFTYTPPTAYTGTRSFPYSIAGDDGVSISADIVFTISAEAPGNAAPIAVMNGYVVAPGGTLTVTAPGVLGNDTDADGDALTVTTYGSAAWGSFTGQADGSFSYVAPPGFEGSVTIAYTVSDGTATATADIVITVETPRDEEPTEPGDPEGPGGSSEPGLPSQPTRPEGDGDGGSLASTGDDLTGAATLTGVAGLLLALGAMLRRLSRRAA